MAKKISDENLLEALLVHGGASGAAAALQISRNAIYKRLKNAEFQKKYNELQGAMLGVAATKMTASLGEAVKALVDVLNDPESSGGLKVQAANALLSHCNRYVENGNILRRLDELEKNLNMNGENEK